MNNNYRPATSDSKAWTEYVIAKARKTNLAGGKLLKECRKDPKFRELDNRYRKS